MEILILTILLFIDLKISRCQASDAFPVISNDKITVPALLEWNSYERSKMCHF